MAFAPTLADLLAPTSLDAFLAEHWEARPLVVARRTPGFYDAAIPVEPLLHLVFEAEMLGREREANPSNVHALRDVLHPGVPRTEREEAARTVEGRRAAYERGATLRVNDVHHRSLPIGALCRDIHEQLSAIAGANLYCSPPSSTGTGLHVDPHDVYVLQLRGKKRWKLFRSKEALPLASVPPFSFEPANVPRRARAGFRARDDERCAELVLETVLEEGDLLYVPRGTFHQVTALEVDTLHVTIGVWPITWMDLVVAACADVARRDERLRRALPVGMLKREAPSDADRRAFADVVAALAAGASADASFAELAGAFRHYGDLGGVRRPASLQRPAWLRSDTVVERAAELDVPLAVEATRVRLVVCGTTVDLPRRYAEAVAWIMGRERFTTAELPSEIDGEAKIALVDRLVRVGLLRPAG